MKKTLRYLTAARGLSPLLGLLVALSGCGGQSQMESLVTLSGCGGQSPVGWERLERDFAAVRSEYQRRVDRANTTVEFIEAAWFGRSRFEELLSRVADLRIASGENAAVVGKEIADLKARAQAEGEQESAKFEGGSFAAYAGGLVANDEVAMAISQMLAAGKGNIRQ